MYNVQVLLRVNDSIQTILSTQSTGVYEDGCSTGKNEYFTHFRAKKVVTEYSISHCVIYVICSDCLLGF